MGGVQGGTERELKISGAALELMVVVSLQCAAGGRTTDLPRSQTTASASVHNWSDKNQIVVIIIIFEFLCYSLGRCR